MMKKTKKTQKKQSSEISKYPENFVGDLEYVVKKLGGKFSFGIYGREDIEQEARLIGLCAYEKYDDSKGELKKFLYVYIRSRLINMMRNNMRRNDPPCKICHGVIEGQTDHLDGKYCEKYAVWKKRNDLKYNLFSPGSIENINYENSYDDDFAKEELLKKIDENISPQNRKYFLKIVAGVSISKYRRKALEEEIRMILGDKEVGEVLGGETK